ncbi:hypothetical protein HDU86_002619 [Geranomyces michiganensis]|nr:hypothetical protein HDU86_002619 [Geranomyces michiganensis]
MLHRSIAFQLRKHIAPHASASSSLAWAWSSSVSLRCSARPVGAALAAQHAPAVSALRRFSARAAIWQGVSQEGAFLQEEELEDSMIDAVNGVAATQESAAVSADAAEPERATFASIAALSEPTQKALLKDFKYIHMSAVQEAVLSLLPTEKDMLVRAKTGTGKTLAFVIASLESAIARLQGKRFNSQQTTILILSPTRELANQISAEAQRICRPHGYRVQTAVGGPGRNRSVAAIVRDRTDVLVATPGRLLDMLENEPDFRRKIQGLQTLIFDEADQLLEMGFKDAIDAIVAKLPAQRQTFMFSATLSPQIQAIARKTLQPDYNAVDTVPVNETPTHLKVKQSYCIVPYSQQLIMLHEMIRAHKKANPAGKIIVFFPTTKVVAYLAGVFNDIPGMDVLEIHSKLSQVQRERVAQRYRRAHGGILFTSDVSARGVDYPGVTLVIQVGVPSSREQYIHRVGRTGRADKNGEGMIMLSPYEERFIEVLGTGIPIKRDHNYGPDAPVITKGKTAELIQAAIKHAPEDMARECYAAFLGFHKQHGSMLRLSKDSLLRSASEFAQGILGLEKPPQLSETLLNNLGLGSRSGGGGGYGSRNGGGGYGSYGSRNSGGDRDRSWNSSRSYDSAGGPNYKRRF